MIGHVWSFMFSLLLYCFLFISNLFLPLLEWANGDEQTRMIKCMGGI